MLCVIFINSTSAQCPSDSAVISITGTKIQQIAGYNTYQICNIDTSNSDNPNSYLEVTLSNNGYVLLVRQADDNATYYSFLYTGDYETYDMEAAGTTCNVVLSRKRAANLPGKYYVYANNNDCANKQAYLVDSFTIKLSAATYLQAFASQNVWPGLVVNHQVGGSGNYYSTAKDTYTVGSCIVKTGSDECGVYDPCCARGVLVFFISNVFNIQCMEGATITYGYCQNDSLTGLNLPLILFKIITIVLIIVCT